MKLIPARMLRWWWTGCAGFLAVYHFQGMLHAANSHSVQPPTAVSAALSSPAAVNAAASDRDEVASSGHSLSAEPIARVCRVTAYCDEGLTAAGTFSGVGQCAAPEDIPFGTIVYIPELERSFIVTDRTHKRFRQNTVDIFIPTEEACRAFGRNYLECEFYLPAREWRRPKSPDTYSASASPRVLGRIPPA